MARSVDLNRRVDLNLLQRAFLRSVNEDTGQTYLPRFDETLRKIYSTFDHRNFGFTSFRTFCESLENDDDVVTDDLRSLFIVERKSHTEKTTRRSKIVRTSEASCSSEREVDGETERVGGWEGGTIRSVAAFSADGRLTGSVSDDNDVKICDPTSKSIEKTEGVVPVTQAEIEKNIRKLRVANKNGKATKEDVQQAVQTLKEFTNKQSCGKTKRPKPHTPTVELNKIGDETLEKAHNVVMGATGVPESVLEANGKGSSHAGVLTLPSQETSSETTQTRTKDGNLHKPNYIKLNYIKLQIKAQ